MRDKGTKTNAWIIVFTLFLSLHHSANSNEAVQLPNYLIWKKTWSLGGQKAQNKSEQEGKKGFAEVIKKTTTHVYVGENICF